MPLARLLALAGVLALAVPVAADAARDGTLARCSGSHLVGRVAASSGAAGTITMAIRVKNVSNVACALRGYPRLRILQGTKPLPTRVTHGGISLLEQPVKTVRLAPGGVASLLVAYEDVPVGNETSCPAGDALRVRPAGSFTAFRVRASTTACGRGHLWTSPFLAGRVGLG